MIKLLLLILAGFVGYSLVSNLLRSIRPSGKHGQDETGEPMVEDPQCGTYIPRRTAHKATIKGRTRYFCSKDCLKQYKKNQ